MNKVQAIGIGIGNAGRKIGCGRAPYTFLNSLKDRRIDTQIYNYVGGRTEVRTMSKYFTKVAKKISKILNNGSFPLALGGDHSCAIATWSGVYDFLQKNDQDLGLIWVDAHMDSHRPATSDTGNIHGMPVAHLLGYGYEDLKTILRDTPKLKPENIVLFGIRSYEPAEKDLLDQLGVKIYYQTELKDNNFESLFLNEFAKLSRNTNGNVGISFDLDALDPVKMDAVGTPVANGISPDVFYDTLTKIDYDDLICFEVAEYNPMLDSSGLSLEYMDKILRLVEGRIKNPETWPL